MRYFYMVLSRCVCVLDFSCNIRECYESFASEQLARLWFLKYGLRIYCILLIAKNVAYAFYAGTCNRLPISVDEQSLAYNQ